MSKKKTTKATKTESKVRVSDIVIRAVSNGYVAEVNGRVGGRYNNKTVIFTNAEAIGEFVAGLEFEPTTDVLGY